jgi:diguanylate cyclase (GGDEF)-like protein/PAS domain S-box-containing protein
MNHNLLAVGIGYIFSAALCLIIARIVWARRENPGSLSFIVLMIAFAIWSAVRFLSIHTEHFESIIIYQIITLTAQTSIGPLLFSFVVYFTEKKKWTKRPLNWLPWVVPVILFLFTVTNQFHGLVYSEITLQTIDSHLISFFTAGPLLYINMIYSYSLIGIGLYWLVLHFLRFGAKGIISAVLIITTSMVTLIINTFELLNIVLISPMDITPHTFSLFALALFWSISQQQLFQITPLAYRTLLKNMPEGVIVINKEGIIITINQAAKNLLSLDDKENGGHSIEQVAPFLCDSDADCYQEKKYLEKEIELPGSPYRIVKLHTQQILNKYKESIGRIITIHDITTLRETEIELRNKYEFMDALVDATADINMTLDLEKVLNKILDNASKIVPYDEADIVLVDENGNYKFVCVKSLNDEHPMDFVLNLEPMNEELLGFEKMANSGEMVLINDTENDPNWNPTIEGTEWIQSYLGAPIQHQGKIQGFLNLAMGTKDAFDWEQARQIQVFANYAASAIANARLFDQTERVALQMSALNEISQMINSGTGLSETLIAALKQLKTILPIDAFGITLLNKNTHSVETYLFYSDESKIDIPPFNFYTQDSITRNVFEKQESLYVPEVYASDSKIKADSISWIDKFHSHTLLATPLIRRGEVFGVMIVGSNERNAYNAEQIELIETVALQSSTSIDNARLFEQVQEQAITDELTGLDNRRHFNLTIDKEIKRARRYKHQLSLIMFDIDDFKDVNDHYGHLVGDFILKGIAEKTKDCLRKTDTPFRYGGEEFVVVLPETEKEQALTIAERIRKTIEESQFGYNGLSHRITVSLGVCKFVNDYHDTAEALIATADKALYSAKAAGKNCVRSCNS